MYLWLLVISLTILTASPFILMKHQAFAASNIGIGIRKNGPLSATVGEKIEYTIAIFNLGDFPIRNITTSDTLPNGTITTWQVPTLAPQGLTGDRYNITGILYTVDQNDVMYNTGSPYLNNHAEVTGYADVPGQPAYVAAETNFPTFILPTPVGGFSIHLSMPNTFIPTFIEFAAMIMLAMVFVVSKRGPVRFSARHSR